MAKKHELTFKERLLKRMKADKKKTDRHVFIVLPLLVVVLVVSWLLESRSVAEHSDTSDSLFTGVFVGDMMTGRFVNHVIDRKGARALFASVQPIFDDADYISGNLENPLTDTGEDHASEKKIRFQADEAIVPVLKQAGFTTVNLANNHMMDYGQVGLEDTLTALERAEMDYVGAGRTLDEAKKTIHYQAYDGLTVATIGFSDAYRAGDKADSYTGGVLTFNPDVFIPLVAEAKENADLVVVHNHWGQEYENVPNYRQREFAHALADAGADIVIGHHPHVLQSMEVYKDTAIFYSLGNFIFDQGWTRTRESALVQYDLAPTGMATFTVTPLKIREATPARLSAIDKLSEVAIIQNLTKEANVDWKLADGKISFTVDHTRILKGKGAESDE